jgi:hypothetical protein
MSSVALTIGAFTIANADDAAPKTTQLAPVSRCTQETIDWVIVGKNIDTVKCQLTQRRETCLQAANGGD